MLTSCPSCGGRDLDGFYGVDGAPTNSVLLLDDEATARSFPKGAIRLTHCLGCGHVFNASFAPERTEYSGRYESTQGYSAVFNAFHTRLADDMIERFDLHGRSIIEIGCGNGEFLTLLCERGGNRGLGFDPAHLPGRVPVAAGTDIRFIADFYGPAYAEHEADFIVCKMTLEHIIDVGRFVTDLRAAIGDRPGTSVCFQIPNARYVLGDQAFWDVYYEHCSYFTHGSLARLFRRAGFEVDDLWTDYDDQYLCVAARAGGARSNEPLDAEADLDVVAAEVEAFRTDVPGALDAWRHRLARTAATGRTTVLWGGGSKAVAFLTTLGIADEIAGAVDINPNKHGTFLAGSGHRVLDPAELTALDPAEVIVMNPVYIDEVKGDLAALGLDPSVTPISTRP